MDNLQRKMDEFKDKEKWLDTQVHKLIVKVMKAKEIDVAKFYKLDAYKLALNTIVAQFFC